MSVTRRNLFIAVFVLALGGVGYEACIVAEQADELRRTQTQQETLAAQLQTLRRQIADANRELAGVRQEIALSEAAIATQNTGDQTIPAEMGPWLARIQTIRHLFATRPELSIPELQFLSESDWILMTREAQLDTDEHMRKSLAGLRDAGKKQFTLHLEHAMAAYLKTSGGELPPTVTALGPYFDVPIDPGILPRYEILQSGNINEMPANLITVVREKNAIDEDYDGRFGLFGNGKRIGGSYGGGNDARTWLPDPGGYDGMVHKAQAQFGLVNNGAKAPGLQQLAPYINPPLSPEKLQKLIDLERDSKR